MFVYYVRGIIVGCGGVGKIIFLKRLGNLNFKDIINIKLMFLFDVYFNEFEVFEEDYII